MRSYISRPRDVELSLVDKVDLKRVVNVCLANWPKATCDGRLRKVSSRTRLAVEPLVRKSSVCQQVGYQRPRKSDRAIASTGHHSRLQGGQRRLWQAPAAANATKPGHRQPAGKPGRLRRAARHRGSPRQQPGQAGDSHACASNRLCTRRCSLPEAVLPACPIAPQRRCQRRGSAVWRRKGRRRLQKLQPSHERIRAFY
ncbi:hypothetical protein B296_00047273 [Ensete ventricosum]|uniref:Uncharacterized protein n=1 Tax=Ensete ventricosum TaxID=4639 RepID=A0A426Y950_ENSVE|nr:hypothetical protein B296_00047273 [Ensete ventricosum]